MLKLFAFLLFPAFELYLLVKVGGMTGAFNMVLWVFVSALIGIAAVRSQKQYSLEQIRSDLAQGRGPQGSIREGLLLFLGGLMLILPGLITDAAGLLLLLPPVRRLIADKIGAYAARHPFTGTGNSRFIFFSNSSGFPGGFDSRTQGPAYMPENDENHDDSPRQAVIIESRAIEIRKEDEDSSTGPSSDTKA